MSGVLIDGPLVVTVAVRPVNPRSPFVGVIETPPVDVGVPRLTIKTSMRLAIFEAGGDG